MRARKVRFEKSLIRVLVDIGTKISGIRCYAVAGILFSKPAKSAFQKRRISVCGCAFPSRLEGVGCATSGAVSKKAIGQVIAEIYKKGYVPVGAVIISSASSLNGHPYGSVSSDRFRSFRFLSNFSGTFNRRVANVVIDDERRPHWQWCLAREVPVDVGKDRKYLVKAKTSKIDKVSRTQLSNLKGGAVWISHDNLVSSTLQGMGIKLSP